MGFTFPNIGKKLNEYAGNVGRAFGQAADAVVPGDQSNWHQGAPSVRPAQVVNKVVNYTNPVQLALGASQKIANHIPTPFSDGINGSNGHLTLGEIDDQIKRGMTSVARDTLQAAPKTLVRVTNQAGNRPSYTPRGKVEQALLGKDKIGNLEDYGRETATIPNAIPGVNVDPSKMSKPGALGLGIAMGALDLTPGGSSKKKAAEAAAKELPKTTKAVIEQAKKSAAVVEKAKGKPKVTRKNPAGMTAEQEIDRVKAAMEASAQNEPKPKVAFQDRPQPVEIKPTKNPDVQEVLQGISRARGVGQVEADLVGSTMRQTAKRLGVDLKDPEFIHRYQTGTLKAGAEKAMGAHIKQVTDKLFEVTKKTSPEVEYRGNYLPQTYKEFDKPNSGAVGFRTTTDAAKPRTFDTYQEAAGYGYNAKMDSVDKMIAAAAQKAHGAAGHADVINRGLDTGVFRPHAGEGGAPLAGFYSPRGEQLYADKAIADVINGVQQKAGNGFAKAVHGAATVSKVAQDIGLQGGIPGTNVNFFVAGQGIKDTTRNIGKFAIHPIQATQQEGHLLQDFFRTNNNTQKRFAKEADFVRKMADRGLYITHQSSLKGEGKNVLDRNWDKLGNNPTFGRFMPNRVLSTAKEIYTQGVKSGMSHEEALDHAAKTAKTFLGVVDEVAKGRSNLTQDAMSAVFFAPKYREGIVNALKNATRSIVDPRTWTDKSFAPSRQLIAGMAVTLYGYNELNKKLNGGKNMWENGKGQELNLQIPYGEKDEKGNQPVMRIPFMPGYMTLPRAAFNATMAATRGDAKGVIAEGGKMMSMPINTATALVGNKDYFGRPIYTDQAVADANGTTPDSGMEKLKKTGAYIVGQNSPAWVRAGINAAQGKPFEQNVATAMEAPVRFGKVTNPETQAYFDTRDKIEKGLNPNEKAAWDALHPAKKDDLGDVLDTIDNVYNPAARLDAYNRFPAVFAADKAMDELNRKQGKAGNPLFDLTPGQVKKVLEKDNLPPGAKDPELSKLYDQPWYVDYKAQQGKFFEGIKQQQKDQLAQAQKVNTDAGRAQVAKLQASIDKFDSPANPYPVTPPELQKTMDYYNALPKGTGARSSWIKANPGLFAEMQVQFAKTDEWQNRQRERRGLAATEGEEGKANGFGDSSSSKKYGSGGAGSQPSQDKYKYAIGLNSGGAVAKPKVSLKGPGVARKKVARKTTKPKVSIKKSLV